MQRAVVWEGADDIEGARYLAVERFLNVSWYASLLNEDDVVRGGREIEDHGFSRLDRRREGRERISRHEYSRDRVRRRGGLSWRRILTTCNQPKSREYEGADQ